MPTLTIKNSDQRALLDEHVYIELKNDQELATLEVLDNLRLHSSGCAVFQKTVRIAKCRYKTKTIYLHKLVAERYLGHAKTAERCLVGTHNGNKLDCRLENLCYLSRSEASRRRKSSNRSGYTGVYKEGKKYRAIINIDGRSKHLGMFATPEEAAHAYNLHSFATFGKRGKINQIPGRENFDYAAATAKLQTTKS